MKKLILLCLSLAVSAGVGAAETMLMARSSQSFPEAMLALQTSITEHGYTVSRVQRVDIGLTSSGYQTDKYRVVFFGKAEEQERMVKQYPELIPYLPLKVTVFAEQDETLVTTFDPLLLDPLCKNNDYHEQLMRWRNDLLSILSEMRSRE